ncbi:YlcI/YnfO family protein [Pseudaminobacter salicylatoxidans]|uniref:YlcI/YnfO family protein n=1 Tax=Pseudaminobacter salicylatoxidans TaxID=93369 RepID=UPI003CC824DB
MPGRFPEGTFDRIDSVLEPGENRADFVRRAVERELKRRKRKAPDGERAERI